jgi:hypothetical protein
LKSALNWPSTPLTVTVNQALSAGASVTFTFGGGANANPVNDDLVEVVGEGAFNGGGCSTALTTAGNPGWSTNAAQSYILSCYTNKTYVKRPGVVFGSKDV